jgi:hypothetical protein
VTTLLLWALKITEPPQRAVILLALPVISTLLPSSLAVTVLKFPSAWAELLLVALTKLNYPALTAVLPFRAMLVFPTPAMKPANAVLLSSAIAVLKTPTGPAPATLLLVAMARFPIPDAVAWLLLYAMARSPGQPAGVSAVLLPVCTKEIPLNEIASPPSGWFVRRRLCGLTAGSCPSTRLQFRRRRQEGSASAHREGSQHCFLHCSSFHCHATHGVYRDQTRLRGNDPHGLSMSRNQ